MNEEGCVTRTIIDYISEEMSSFDVKPFNPLDSLALSLFCSMWLDDVISAISTRTSSVKHVCDEGSSDYSYTRSGALSHRVRMKELLRAEMFQSMLRNVVSHAKERVKLLYALAASPRFRDLEIFSYRRIIDKQSRIQFGSTTLVHGNTFAYVGFQGTDSSITGWREDFDMSYLFPVAAQDAALQHIESIAPMLPKRLYVGGHSKGGNLAEYAAAKATTDIRRRIERVYDHDGPGFMQGSLSGNEVSFLQQVAEKFVPQDSIVGLLLNSPVPPRVVHSGEMGFRQHSGFSWEINADGTDFITQSKGLTKAAVIRSETLNEWNILQTKDEMSHIVKSLFDLIEAGGVEDVSILFEGGAKTFPLLLRASVKTPAASREILEKSAKDLSSILSEKIAERK